MSYVPEKLPEDLESEIALLSTVCAPGAEVAAEEVASVLTEADFIHPKHRCVFKALCALVDRREEINALTLKDELAQQGNLGRVGGYSALVELLMGEEVGRPKALCEILQRKRKLRELIRMGAQVITAAVNEEEPDGIVETTCGALAGMALSRGEDGPVAVGEVSGVVLERVIAEASGKAHFGARTGFYRFDGITRGFKPGELIILAARPGVGKSTLALNWARGVAQRSAVPLFSLEMSREEITRKLLSDMSGINLREVRESNIDALWHAKNDLDTLPILIDDRSGINVRQIRSKVERIQARQSVGLVVIDYLQLLTSVNPNVKQNETNRIGEISRELKIMAKDCQVPVLVLSQLNREVEKRTNGKPQLSDLRDSGCIEQDADMVVFIHRKIVPGLEPALQDRTGELHIAKHRNGPCGSVPLLWDGALSRFAEQERETNSGHQTEYRPGYQAEIPYEEAV